jgi:transposase
VWYSRPLPPGKIKDGTSFAQDARRRWYLNVVVEIPDVKPRAIEREVGIDLGLKDLAVLSTGEKIEKAIARAAWVQEVDERLSTQVCSACGSLPEQRPKGIADLGIREWTCGDCGSVHDRDQNAALNILRVGHHSPVVGIAGR